MSLAAEVARPLAAGGEILRQRLLQLSRSLFGVAVAALLAIAGTVGAMHLVHEQTARWVQESREISRLVRTAYVLTVERELLRRANAAWPEDRSPQARTARRAADRFDLTLDTLQHLAGNSADRIERFDAIRRAQKQWTAMLDKSFTSSSAATRRLERKRFDVLRARLGLLVLAEEVRYSARIEREKNIRILSTVSILAELLILLFVISGIRRRLVAQATAVLQQKEELKRQAEEQQALFTAITEVFFVLDREGRYHKVAPANNELLARSRDELLGRTISDALPPDVAELCLASIAKALDTQQRVEVEYALDLRGRNTWFSGTVTPLGDDRVLWVARDVSESKLTAAALKESEARFRNLVEHSPQAVALHAGGRLLYVNPACATLLGFANEDKLLGQPLSQFVTRETAQRLTDSFASLDRSPSRSVTCECQFHRLNDSRLFTVEVTSVPVTYGRAGVLSILHDVTERRQLEDQLAHQAFHDPLTSLANRVLFRDRVEHALQRAARGKGAPSVLFIDLDNFKAVNDGLGHSAGDWLLIEVAARLNNCLRPADTVARLGGDEFAVLLDDETAHAPYVAERILQAFRVPFSVQGTDIVVTMSIGIASLQPHQGADDVLRNADLALYRAKAQGKACAASFEPEMHVAALRRLEMEADLRRAIDGDATAGTLVIEYQPITRMSTGRMFGFEALVRWVHPERGVLEPLDFISLAEETGLIVPLGRWVLGEACRQTVEWKVRFGAMLKGTGIDPLVSVNISGRHLSQPEILNHISDCLKNSGLAPNDLVLEMTETMLVHDNRATLQRLHSLKGLGIRLSIDDFGTGYSSLAYLERFPVDMLKMDRSFITGLAQEGGKSPLAEAVIGLGRILGLRVVAEGIETAEQWDRLRQLGCALGQGFHLARPMSPTAFEVYLKAVIQGVRILPNGRFPVGRNGGGNGHVNDLAAIS